MKLRAELTVEGVGDTTIVHCFEFDPFEEPDDVEEKFMDLLEQVVTPENFVSLIIKPV